MSKVKITPNDKGQLVIPYDGNTKYGYVMLAQSKDVVVNGWLKDINLRSIIKGQVSSLTNFVNDNPDGQLEGNLVVTECMEDEIPDHMSASHFDKKLSFEEQIAKYIKTAGDGPALKVEGKRIIRFVDWDNFGTQEDVTVQHDNVVEIAAYNQLANKEAAVKAEKADAKL